MLMDALENCVVLVMIRVKKYHYKNGTIFRWIKDWKNLSNILLKAKYILLMQHFYNLIFVIFLGLRCIMWKLPNLPNFSSIMNMKLLLNSIISVGLHFQKNYGNDFGRHQHVLFSSRPFSPFSYLVSHCTDKFK